MSLHLSNHPETLGISTKPTCNIDNHNVDHMLCGTYIFKQLEYK